MSAQIRNYYTCANSARGFVNMFDSNIKGLDKIFILKGGPGTGKSSLMRNIGMKWYNKGFDVEFIHCSSDNGSLDGVIIPALKIGIVDGTAPHIIEPSAPGAIEEYVNLGAAWNSKSLSTHKNEILNIKNEISKCYEDTYKTFGEAIKIHDEWEKIYIENIDFEKVNKVTSDTIKLLLENKRLDKSSTVKHRFFGGATPKGAVDFVQNLTEDISKRYFIKGRPGSGKSTMLKKIAAEAERRGFDVEVYHCGFDPDSLDMVVIRELSTVIFDSTSPHEYYPDRDSDEIIDMYALTIKEGTDEKYKEELDSIIASYKEKVNKGTQYLAKAKSLHDDMEKFYIEAMDFKVVDKIANNLIGLIEKHQNNIK